MNKLILALGSLLIVVAFYGCADTGAQPVTSNVNSIKYVPVFNPKDFGAKGDGVTDDTEAFNKLDIVVQKAQGPIHIHIPAGVFMVNPLKIPNHELVPGKWRRRSLIVLRNDHSMVTCNGLVKIIKGPNYKVGMKKGEEFYWAVVILKANFCTIDGLNFDGNGTGTYTGWITEQANIRWSGVSGFGPGDLKFHVGNKVINCNIIGGGGQAVGLQYQKQALIANNTFQDSSGAGFSYSHDCIVTGNTAIRSHDAPYLVNGRCNNIIISNNISRGTTNGSGIDVVGCNNILVKGNVIEDSAAWGLLIGYSAQQKIGGERILVEGNIFVNNCRSEDTPMNAEICVGRPWSKTDNVAKDVTITDNQFFIDGRHGDFKGNMISVAYGTKNLVVKNNVANGYPNEQRAIMTVWSKAKNIYMLGNVWLGKEPLHIAEKAKVEGAFVIKDNKNIDSEPR